MYLNVLLAQFCSAPDEQNCFVVSESLGSLTITPLEAQQLSKSSSLTASRQFSVSDASGGTGTSNIWHCINGFGAGVKLRNATLLSLTAVIAS